MTVLDLIKGRYSVRRYTESDVPDADLQYILEAARWSQSAKNLQEWRLVVVKSRETREKLAVAARGQRFVADAPVVIACCAVGTAYVMACGQPAYPIDVSIAMENMALAAHERGLGTCWLGAFYEDQVKSSLKIPDDDIRVVGLLTLGYPAGSPPLMKNRKAVESFVTYESW